MKWNLDQWVNQTLITWEKRPRIGWLWSSLWIAGLTGLAFLWQLGSFGLVDETEPLFAEAARQMIVREDWVTPYFNGQPRFDKPPLIYWLMAIGFKTIGVNEWAVRLPSALGAIGLIIMTFYVLRHYGWSRSYTRSNKLTGSETKTALSVPSQSKLPQSKLPESKPSQPSQPLPSQSVPFQAEWSHDRWLSAWLAVGILAFSGEMLAWGRIGVSDMVLNGCIGIALLSFFMGYAAPSGKVRWYCFFYGFVGLAILAKGPVGIVIPGLVIGLFLLYLGQLWNVLQEMQLLKGIAIILLLTVPWHGLIIQANGEAYLRSFFGYHNFERFTQVVNNHSAPWYFYIIVIFLGFAPWSIYLPLAIARLRVWNIQRWRNTPRDQQLSLFAFCWFIGIFSFFTIAVTKLPSYVLPLMPAAAILVALLWSQEHTWTRLFEHNLAHKNLPGKNLPGKNLPGKNLYRKRYPWSGLQICGWLNVLFVIILAIGFFLGPTWIAEIRDPSMPEFPQAINRSGLLVVGGLTFVGMAIALVTLLLRLQIHWLWSINLTGFIILFAFTLIPTLSLLDYHRQFPLRQIAETAAAVRYPNEELIMMGFEKPSIVFYGEQPVFFFRRYHSTLRHVYSQTLPQPDSDTLLLLTYPRRFPALGLEDNDYQSLRQAGAYELIRVPKEVFKRKPAQFE